VAGTVCTATWLLLEHRSPVALDPPKKVSGEGLACETGFAIESAPSWFCRPQALENEAIACIV
jgi:hypothetical protein